MTEKIILPEPFRTDWLKALRSGKYRQGVGALHSYVSNTFCCLGVAADITTDVEWGRISPSLRVELVKKRRQQKPWLGYLLWTKYLSVWFSSRP
jgi:hypothetical protein